MNKEFVHPIASNEHIYKARRIPKHQSLSEKVVRAGLWVFGLKALSRGLGFIRTVVLARLLSPSDFGLFGIALLSISIIENFSQTGIQAALVRKKKDVVSYLDTAWTVTALRGMVLFMILFLASPVIAKFFNSPQAVTVIRVIAVSTLFSGFKNIGLLFFQKKMEFKRLFTYELSAVLVEVALAIVLAIFLRSVWALVWAGLAANSVRLIMSYFIQSYRPRLIFEKEKFRELFGFGKWILGSSILVFLVNQGDDILVGKMLGVSALGLYQMAYLLSNLPATEITNVISQVSFPAYSKIQNNLPELKKIYLEIFKTTMIISFPIAGGILVLGLDFTKIFLGEKWLPMVTAMQVLAFWGLIRSSGGLPAPLFQALNRPEISTKLLFIKLALLSLFIYPLTMKWGILGTALAVLLNAMMINPIAHYISIRMVGGNSKDIVKIIFGPAVSTVVMVAIIAILKTGLKLSGQAHYFFAIAIVGIAVYLICVSIFEKQSILSKILFLAKR